MGYVWQCVTRRRSWTRTATAVRGRRTWRLSKIAYRVVSTGSLSVWPSTIVEITGSVSRTIISQLEDCSGTTAATDTRSSVTRVRNSDNKRHVESHILLCQKKQTWAPCACMYDFVFLPLANNNIVYRWFRKLEKSKRTTCFPHNCIVCWLIGWFSKFVRWQDWHKFDNTTYASLCYVMKYRCQHAFECWNSQDR